MPNLLQFSGDINVRSCRRIGVGGLSMNDTGCNQQYISRFHFILLNSYVQLK